MSLKEIIDHFKQEGAVIKKAPFAFATCVLLPVAVAVAVIMIFVNWHYAGIIEQKDATTNQKEATIQRLEIERDGYRKQLEDAGNYPYKKADEKRFSFHAENAEHCTVNGQGLRTIIHWVLQLSV